MYGYYEYKACSQKAMFKISGNQAFKFKNVMMIV